MTQSNSSHLRPISDQPIFVTILSDDFLPGAVLSLTKDGENEYDDEAIVVNYDPPGAFDNDAIIPGSGYDCMPPTTAFVANSVKTVARGTYSAGRLYDKFEGVLEVKVRFVVHRATIAEVLGERTNDAGAI